MCLTSTLASFGSVTVHLHEAIMLEYGIWGSLNPCSWAVVIHI